MQSARSLTHPVDARGAQVKARVRECQLHRDSPLGDALLECYACGSRNAFALGFVPVGRVAVACPAVTLECWTWLPWRVQVLKPRGLL